MGPGSLFSHTLLGTADLQRRHKPGPKSHDPPILCLVVGRIPLFVHSPKLLRALLCVPF